MLEYYAAGAGLRLAQIVIYSSLWIVIGLFVAAFFRRVLGAERTRKFFGNGTRRGLLVGWLMGMLIPVCSLGVIPIVREMHRSRVQGGTIIAFGLTAPLFNPLSVLYGLTLSDPIAIITFSFCSLLIVSGLGFLWDWLYPVNESKIETKPEKSPAYGIKRMVSMLDSCATEAAGPALLFIVIGMLSSAIVATLLPFGYLQGGLEQTNLLAPVKVSAIATPIYTTPLLAMSQIGGMFQHGNSIGAAFSLLILGAGINLGLVVCYAKLLGVRRILLFLTLLVGTTLALAYTISEPLYPEGVEYAGHSHAFDVYSNPFNSAQSKPAEVAGRKAAEFWLENELGGTYLLVGLIFLGVVFRSIRKMAGLEAWYQIANTNAGKYDKALPGWVLAATMMLLLVGISIGSCYIYYPGPKEVLAGMDNVNTECVLSSRNKKWEAAEHWIRVSDDFSRRLEIGVYLRHGPVDEFQSTTAQLYREKLDELKHSVDDQDSSRIVEQAIAVQDAYRRMKKIFKQKYCD